MDLNLILGFCLAGFAFYSVQDVRENIMSYIQLDSLLFVLIGTLASTFISTSFKTNKKLLSVIKQVFLKPKALKTKPQDIVNKLVYIAERAQGASKQDLVKEGRGIGDGFLERSLNLMASGLDREFIHRALETDVYECQRRHQMVIGTVKKMGTFAPMFGMTGTVLGVVQVLKDVTDIDTIVSGLSLALLTTLYGIVLSGIIFLPFANKLQEMSDTEVLIKQIILEGVLAIMDKEIPLKVEKKLLTYLEGKLKDNAS